MICLAHYWAIFTDPLWGPVSLQISVWRDSREGPPEYTVVVE